MPEPQVIPSDRLGPPDRDGFLAACRKPNNLVYFLINVGDGDCQLILLPPNAGANHRRAIVVDAYSANKLIALTLSLQAEGLLKPPALTHNTAARNRTFPLVVATHPHRDHMLGFPRFFEAFGNDIAEYWDSGYYHPIPEYLSTMTFLEGAPHIAWSQPSSGTRRFVDGTRVTVLAPGVTLKQRYDTYGVHPNNASLVLKIEHPFRRVTEASVRDNSTRLYTKIPRVRSLVLGADAQSLSWAQVQVDFPELETKYSAVAQELKMARGLRPLKADIFKISHHASKRGVHLELIEALAPSLCLVSSVRDGGSHGFPHDVAQRAIREAMEKIADSDKDRSPDHEIGIFYTGDVDSDDSELGTIAMVISPSRRPQMWRFGDRRDQVIQLENARLLEHRP